MTFLDEWMRLNFSLLYHSLQCLGQPFKESALMAIQSIQTLLKVFSPSLRYNFFVSLLKVS